MKPEYFGAYYESILEKEVRKRGGIYYTPQPIVDYLVADSVGKLLQGKTPSEAAKIRIVDPACGGGIFLLGAYQYLLDWHEKHSGKLTLAKRHKILTDNIFGVDIDPLAVEITKYCLAMKCSEGYGFTFDFSENIRCGNSLIETNFHWQREFPRVFQQGGFDIVIGNPPYGAKYPVEHKGYFLKHYKSAKTTTINGGNGNVKTKGSLDTFSLFIENGFNNLRENGFLTFIVPLSVVSSDSMAALHDLLEKHCSVIKVASLCDRPQQIFRHSHKKTAIISFRKDNQKNKCILSTQMYRKDKGMSLEDFISQFKFIDVSGLGLDGRYAKISLPIEKRILKKLRKIKTNIGTLKKDEGKTIYYRFSGGMYYNIITNYSSGSTQERSLYFEKMLANSIGAILSSSLFWWYQQVYTDNLHIKSSEIESFPIPVAALTASVRRKIEKLYERYLQDIEHHVNERESHEYKHITKFKEYKIRYSKVLIDAMDDIICPLYGLTEAECEFIKNYELRFRIDDPFEEETK